jgi:hypothetical protein
MDEEETTTGDKPICKYGENCYRKNPEHFKCFSHPKELLRSRSDGGIPKSSNSIFDGESSNQKKRKIEEPIFRESSPKKGLFESKRSEILLRQYNELNCLDEEYKKRHKTLLEEWENRKRELQDRHRKELEKMETGTETPSSSALTTTPSRKSFIDLVELRLPVTPLSAKSKEKTSPSLVREHFVSSNKKPANSPSKRPIPLVLDDGPEASTEEEVEKIEGSQQQPDEKYITTHELRKERTFKQTGLLTRSPSTTGKKRNKNERKKKAKQLMQFRPFFRFGCCRLLQGICRIESRTEESD